MDVLGFGSLFQSDLAGTCGNLLQSLRINPWVCDGFLHKGDETAHTKITDIERCATDLLPLLDRAATLGLEGESLFMDYCQEITDGIGQYPEHIYIEDGVSFERTATECVLKWLDLRA